MPQQGSPPTSPASRRAAPRIPSPRQAPRQATTPTTSASTSAPTFSERLGDEWERLRTAQLSAWMLLPLRLFLGVTFVYAGAQKLTDPQYFKPSAIGYIGRQITSFAAGSPLKGFLLTVVAPHAMLFGALVAYGELAIGLGVLVGMLLRPAAFFGALLSLLFFLTASWRVYPYFYGADIVFFFAWIPMILAGPASGGYFALDTVWVPRLLARLSPERQAQMMPTLSLLVGVPGVAGAAGGLAGEAPVSTAQHGGQAIRAGNRRYANNTQSRREFIWGVIAGGLGALGIAWVFSQMLGAISAVASGGASTAPAGSGGSGGASTGGAGGSSSGATGSGSVIAKTADVTANNSASFTVPNGDPGVLVHLKSGSFVAFDATCTHAGCPVSYDPGSQLLLCPCHGAAFDPAHAASVVQGPAQTPLTSVAINVDNATGEVTLA